MAVKIKLKRMGKIRAPYYRVVVADARAKRDGRAIEEIGKYHPKQEPSLIEINSERAQYWLSVGAQPTDPVRHLFKITGDWQKFRGEDGAEGTLKIAAPGPDKKDAFAVALSQIRDEAEAAATTSKSRGRRPETKSDRADTAVERAGTQADKPAAKATKPEVRTARTGKAARAGAGAAKAAEVGAAEAKPAKAADKPEKAERTEKPERPEKADRARKPDRSDKPEKAEKPEKAAAAKATGRVKAAVGAGPGQAAEHDKAGARATRKRPADADAGGAAVEAVADEGASGA